MAALGTGGVRRLAVDAGFDFRRFRSDCQFGAFGIGVETEAAVRLSGNDEFAEGETLDGHAAGGTLQRQGERSVGVGLVGDPGARRRTGEQPHGLAWRRGKCRVFHGKPAAVADGKLGRLKKLRPRVVATVDLAGGVFFGVSVPAHVESAVVALVGDVAREAVRFIGGDFAAEDLVLKRGK